jgi:hypothetical protein
MRVLARVLLGLGVFLVIAGVLAVAWAPDVVKKTPLDVDTETIYAGEAAKINPATGDFDKKPVYALTYTKADSDKSDDDTVIFVENSCAVFDTGGAQVCVNGNDPDLITAAQDIFAVDRVTAEGTESDDLPPEAIFPEGLVNKFPFDVEKKTYPFWDGTVGRAVDIEYQGEKTLEGLTTYEFSYTLTDEPIEIAEGIQGTYDNTVTVNVDPTTGSIVKSGQDQQRFLEDGTPALDIQVTQTEDSVKTAVDEAKTNGKSLTLLLKVVPIVGFAGGALCLLAGFALLRRPRGEEAGKRVVEKEKAPAGA